MADYTTRLERLEQQASATTEGYTLVYCHDGDERPYGCITYRETYGGEERVMVRADGESVPDLKRRACDAWGIAGESLICVHFVGRSVKTGKWFTDAEYEAIGAPSARTINHAVSA